MFHYFHRYDESIVLRDLIFSYVCPYQLAWNGRAYLDTCQTTTSTVSCFHAIRCQNVPTYNKQNRGKHRASLGPQKSVHSFIGMLVLGLLQRFIHLTHILYYCTFCSAYRVSFLTLVCISDRVHYICIGGKMLLLVWG